MLLYRKQSVQMEEFFQMLQCLAATYSIDITVGDFKCDLLKESENKFLDIFTDQVQMVNKPTNISGSLIDHVCIKKGLVGEMFFNTTVQNIYVSDHDAL